MNFAGHWEGSIALPSGELKVMIDLDRDAKGAWIGDIDIPDRAVRDLPLSNVSVSGELISFELPGGQGNPVLRGRVSDDGTILSGEFSQAGNSAPFTLKRTGEARVAVPARIPAIPEKFIGRWDGKLDTSGGPVHLIFHLSNKDGFAVSTIDSPDQGAVGIPISFISAGENALKIEVKLIPAEYNGRLSEDGKTLAGEWSQGGKPLPLVLAKK